LKSIEGIVSLLRAYPEVVAKDEVDYNSLLRSAAGRIQTILLQFDELRLNSEKPLNLRAVELPKMVERVIEPFRPKLTLHGIELKMQINQKGQFHSDVARIETIFSELVANAINFNDREKKIREMSIYITASSSSCSIQVHDNGIGIRNEDIGKVFDLFFRGHECSAGSGLGLFIARQNTEKLKGILTVQSALRSKTMFSLWIPNRIR
jgi:two-component system, sensor histidine kinase and response regulator